MSGGRGRGNLLQLLREASAKITESEVASPIASENVSGVESVVHSAGGESDPKSGNASGPTSAGEKKIGSDNQQISDSGIQPTPPPIRAGMARGKLFENLSSMTSKSGRISTSSDEMARKELPKLGAGRASLLSALNRRDATKVVPSLPQSLERLRIADTPTTEQAVDTAFPQLAPVQIEEEKDLEVVRKHGTHGTKINCYSNYIRIKCDPKMGVFEYEVRFDPPIHSLQLRYRLLNQHRDELGGSSKSFDGVTLYLPIRLPDSITKYESVNQNDSTTVQVTIIYRRQMKVVDCMHLYNVMFDRIMKILKFVRCGRKNFDPSEPKVIPQHKLEVWPGYVTAVDEYEDGIMMCVDVNHRVLSTATVLEKLEHAHRSAKGNMQEFKNNVEKALLGAVVLTRYNNKTYRIDDIDFTANPMNTFRSKDRDVTYAEYYKSHYNIELKDLKQPLLISRKERRVDGQEGTETLTFCLIPEICYLTGLTDELRADFRVMKDIATFTRITPNQRVNALQQFCKRVNAIPEAKAVLSGWGLAIDTNPLPLQARQLGEESVIFANNRTFSAGKNADFGKYATSNQLLQVIHLTTWILLHTRNDNKSARAFVENMERNSKPMGINVCAPQIIVLDNDHTDTYIKALRQHTSAKTQIVVAICPTSRDDRYAAIKKVCCAEMPIPSQVINARTLSNEAKNRSIVQKIALQMNCKMGGTLWSIKIPFDNVMICGIDSYHEVGGKGNSVSAFVASLNSAYTRWYSKAVLQSKKEELMHGLVDSFQKSLTAYKTMNGRLPHRIIIYRDGVSDSQLKLCKEYELVQLKKACEYMAPDYQPEFLFIVVQKRINTRIFAKMGTNVENPNPGVILDHSVTRRYMYDFFLVPQSVRQGTVTPTHMIVVHDETDLSPDVVQRLSYKLCFLYYNWPGTVRVPACCQYAHKLSFLVGQSIKRETSEKLADKLFYL